MTKASKEPASEKETGMVQTKAFPREEALPPDESVQDESQRILSSRCAAYEGQDRVRLVHSYFVHKEPWVQWSAGGRWERATRHVWTLRPGRGGSHHFRRFERSLGRDGFQIRDVTGRPWWPADLGNLPFGSTEEQGSAAEQISFQLWDLVTSLYARNNVPLPPWIHADPVTTGQINWAIRVLPFPFAGNRPAHLLDSALAGAGVAFREGTARGFVKVGFGARHLRRDVVREAGSARASALVSLAHCASALDTDTIVDALRSWRETAENYEPTAASEAPRISTCFRTLGSMAPLAHPGFRRRLLLRFDPANGLHIDTIRMFDWGAPQAEQIGQARNWAELHDRLARHQGLSSRVRDKELASRKITQDGLYPALDGATLPDGVHLVSAKDGAALDEWSELMNNCIWSYKAEAVTRNMYFFALHDRAGAMFANLAVYGDAQVHELAGKYNQPVNPDLEQQVRTLLETTIKTTTAVAAAQH